MTYNILANLEQVRNKGLPKKGKVVGGDKKEFVYAYDPISDLFLIQGIDPLKSKNKMKFRRLADLEDIKEECITNEAKAKLREGKQVI